jgi:tetratricopeptide (TPR) repeat protein
LFGNFLSVAAMAQTPVRETLLQQANRQFDTQSYAKAVALYQEALDEGLLPLEQRKLMQLNMAYSYFKLGDNAKAEQFYQETLPEEPFRVRWPTIICIMQKCLANNGKMQESQRFLNVIKIQNFQKTAKYKVPKPLRKRKSLTV